MEQSDKTHAKDKYINLIKIEIVVLLISPVLFFVAYFIISKTKPPVKWDCELKVSPAIIYDQEYLTGQDVLYTLNRYMNEPIYIKVNNGKNTTVYKSDTQQKNLLRQAKKSNSPTYINPKSTYLGTVVYQEDGNYNSDILGIYFEICKDDISK